MDELVLLVAEICAKDKMLGDLSRECLWCAENNQYMAALACLFILVEQSIKMAMYVTEGHFATLLESAKENGIISLKEYGVINQMREIRNKLFHENHYAGAMEKDGLIWQFSEDETKELLFNELSLPCFNVIFNLLNKQGVLE